MAIFGRMTARQRLRRATRESLTIPAFSSPIDCTPWVTGGIWPAQLTMTNPETASLAEHLRADLERIARSANDRLKVINRAGLPDAARQAEEARVIDDARARAVSRVESTIRQLEVGTGPASAPPVATPDLGATQVIPAVVGAHAEAVTSAPRAPEPHWRAAASRRYAEPRTDEDDGAVAAQLDDTQVTPAVTDVAPVAEPAAEPPPPGSVDEAPEALPAPPTFEPEAAAAPPRQAVAPTGESDQDRLSRLLEFVVRQEPRLNWAVGDHADGTTVVVTDLANGWVPPGIALPAGVRLLDPARRSGKPTTLIGEATRVATYAPGDSLRRSGDFATTKSSLQPRELPVIEDLGNALNTATRRRDGLPSLVHAMASTAAAGTRIADQEADVLRVHLDTARYQLMVQYPNVNPALLQNCLLLAATEAFVIGDLVSANYHLRWFQELEATPPTAPNRHALP